MDHDATLFEMKQQWTDQFVTVDDKVQHGWHRFAGQVGRVVTINGNLKCLVDFQDGAWYDIAPEHLKRCSDQAASSQKYSTRKNSAQRNPVRQG